MSTAESQTISQTICQLHPQRAAAARCPLCRTFFCSECVTEHEGKLTCHSCLRETSEAAEIKKTKQKGKGFAIGKVLQITPLIHLMIALVVMWIVFYSIAQLILDIPHNFHDGTIWE